MAALGPGKTSPRICLDFLEFDPLNANRSINTLTDRAPILGEPSLALPSKNVCKHDYAVKHNQSQPPPLDLRPDGTTLHKLAITCRNCRLHAEVAVDYRHASNPCPNSTYPIHHFRRLASSDEAEQTHLKYVWQCSSPECNALLNIIYKAQRLSPEHIRLLTDTSLLHARYEDILHRDPEREGIRQATPVDALTRLKKYIKDALNPEHSKRIFPANNKRFMEAFGWYGADCRSVLEYLGFQYSESEYTWTLPNPSVDSSEQHGGNPGMPEFLEDVELELSALIFKISKEMNLSNPLATEIVSSANRDLERTLSAQGYPRAFQSRRPIPDLNAYFASLGALPDFADSLVEFCHDRQAMCDPEQQPYYFECLREIAAARNSEALLIKSTMLESQGCVTRSDLKEAYSFFNLPQGGGGADDDRIMNVFQAMQSDLGAEGSEKARQMLFRIGNSRGSRILINAAQQSIETMQEALTWLGNGVNNQTTDDMLIAVFGLRTEGDPAKEEIGRKAIAVIAQDRQSTQLKTWLDTGRVDGYTMSVDEALRHLDITDNLDSVDDTLWPSIFDNARQTRPGPQTDKAIATIQQALAGVQPSYTAESWPVGLTSLGNTCYLNSLLQYYFSIRPLREIVLEYDKYKFDLSTASEKAERVGQRQISPLEIKGGQKFAEDLKHLFERMITDPSSAVKPEQDLVCRAFLDPKDSDLWDNKDNSTVEHAVEDAPMLDAEVKEITDVDEETDKSGAKGINGSTDSAAMLDSSTTLGSSTTAAAEELVDVKMDDALPSPPQSVDVDASEASKQAPPLPPRRFSTTTNAALERAQSNATQQQDVTEVHDGIQFRLRAGMMPKDRDASGEQLDDLLELFSISLADTMVKDGTPLKPQLLRDSAIQLNVLTEPTDLYSALDAVFDQQAVDGSNNLERYKSIDSLPPFLQINIPRVGFDKAKGEQFKSEHSIKLVDELFMDRYCASDKFDIIGRRQKAWAYRRKMSELKKEHGTLRDGTSVLDSPTALTETAKYIQQLGHINEGLQELGIAPIDHEQGLSETLLDSAKQQAVRFQALDAEVSAIQTQLDGLFEDLKTVKYRLQAVFFHRGKTAHGHYWICVRDFTDDTWRRYNDERVEKVASDKLNEIFEANDWAHGTPTYAVYVRDDLKTTAVQPVCRHLQKGSDQSTSIQDASNTDVAMVSQPEVMQPNHFVIEGSDESWDKPREVAQGSW